MTRPITEDQARALIASYRADVDRYRDRARSVATLLATAAGALAVGLIFSSEGQSLPTAMKVVGYFGIILLSGSVCLFLGASMYRLPNEKNGQDEGRTAGAEQTVQRRLNSSSDDATTVVEAISDRMCIGKILGIVGLAALLLMPLAGVGFPESRTEVVVQITEPFDDALVTCPAIATHFEGTVESTDLDGDSALLPIEVDREQCGNAADPKKAVLYLDRSKVVLTILDEL